LLIPFLEILMKTLSGDLMKIPFLEISMKTLADEINKPAN